ncbi:MAG: hypothetical protein HQL95_15850, partial [Magnetococcales bacterium]|nr:hypothetical protein [Magnetococcales bacterium]
PLVGSKGKALGTLLLTLARFSKGNCAAISARAQQTAKRRLFSRASRIPAGSKNQHPEMVAVYHRLVLDGKCKKMAITACMRTLLTIINVMVKNQTQWQALVANLA